MLLWGGDNWSGNKEHIKKIEVFQNKAALIILGITTLEVKGHKMANDEIRLRLGIMLKVEETWSIRYILLIGHIARMNESSCLRKIVTETCEGRRSRSRSLRNTRNLLAEGLRLLIDDVDPRGNLND